MGKKQLFQAHEVNIGGVVCGGQAPVRLQSMTTTDTKNVEETVNQVIRLVNAGCDYVRITVVTLAHVESIQQIKKSLRNQGIEVPIIADVHFSRKVALAVAPFVEKVRVNPGNFTDTRFIQEDSYDEGKYKEAFEKMAQSFKPLIEICKKYQTAMRIGVNHGSLSGRIMYKYGDTPLGMVISGLEFLDICEAENFDQVILSMKASCPRIMVEVNRLLVKKMKKREKFYPIHLGVTEAGDEQAGRLKSAIGIGTLLSEGIGDTVRVSLTEAPEKEVPVARLIIQNCSQRHTADQVQKNERFWLRECQGDRVMSQTKEPMNFKNVSYPIVIEKEVELKQQPFKTSDAIWSQQQKKMEVDNKRRATKRNTSCQCTTNKKRKSAFYLSMDRERKSSF